MSSLVSALAMRSNTSETRVSAWPAPSSASMVLAKVGGAPLLAMAATSREWSAKARAKAGMKWRGAMRANGGTPNGPLQSSSRGLSSWIASTSASFMLAIWGFVGGIAPVGWVRRALFGARRNPPSFGGLR
jgi:hypothetical protein